MVDLYNMSKLMIVDHTVRVGHFSPCQAIFFHPVICPLAPYLSPK